VGATVIFMLVDNDPHEEHDLGSFELAPETFFCKINYYDETFTYGSEDPYDSGKTTRMLTLMLASDHQPYNGEAF